MQIVQRALPVAVVDQKRQAMLRERLGALDEDRGFAHLRDLAEIIFQMFTDGDARIIRLPHFQRERLVQCAPINLIGARSTAFRIEAAADRATAGHRGQEQRAGRVEHCKIALSARR